jgi:putative multiple sugar transport system ATP-binding protein
MAAQGIGLIVISSELPELLGISDRIYTIFEGAITNDIPAAQADPETVMKSMTSAKKKVQLA